METVALISSIAIFLLNQVTTAQITETELNPALEVNTLPEGFTDAIFALQIRQIRATSEATPAASAGNNLNVVGASVPGAQLQSENYQAIPTIYSQQNKKAIEKKYNDKDEGNVNLQAFDRNAAAREINADGTNIKPLALVWDSCMETNFRDNQRISIQPLLDMEDAENDSQFQKNRQIGSIWSEGLTKRDADNTNNSLAIKSWIEKYKSLRTRTTNVPFRKSDSLLIRKIEKPTSTEISSTTMKMIPITRELFNEPTETFNISVDVLVTENNIRASYTEDWFEPNDRSKIRFGLQPQSETYLIPALMPEEGFYPFGFMSQFFAIIYPFEFPVGLVKDIVWGNFSFPYSFLQSIKVESTFLAVIVIFSCIAFIIPAYMLILAILSLFSKSGCDDETETGALFPDDEDSDYNGRVLVVLTLFLALFCCIFISGMALSNEQAADAAADSRNIVSCACADIATWLAASARELHHALVLPMDIVVHAYRQDLRNVGPLLGEPVQQAIASESGIDLVFDSLADIISESEDIATKIASLRDVSIRAGALASTASDRIRDLTKQLDNLKKHCTAKDAPLCDTINTNSLEIQLKFDLILREQQLLELRTLGVENLTRAISNARQEFRTLPHAITTQTTQVREAILRDIEAKRQTLQSAVRILSDMVRHLTAGLHSVVRQFDSALVRMQKYEFWRWTILLACVVTVGFVMTLMLLALMCGCSNSKELAKRTLQISAVWMCAVSLVLWGVISAIFVIAGHAEVFVCRALWDTPQYQTLSALLDRPSPLLTDKKGIFDALFSDLENITIDVSVKDVLRDCEKDRPAYIVFQLDKVLDVNKETSYFEWDQLQMDLEGLTSSIDVRFLKTISVNFNKLLNRILQVSDVNLSKYRMEYNGPVVGKDLPSLVDQLENIGAQISDLTTAGRLETLATRTKRLHITNIKPLEQLRADVVYKLTELELQLLPFRRKLNISLSHIYTAQYYIDNQGETIAHKKVAMYVSRLVSHVAGWRTHALTAAGKHAARCRPLFTVYEAARSLLCTRYIGSLHGWWFCGLLLGVTWCTFLTPISVKLWRAYGRKIRARDALNLTTLGSGRQETPTTALCEGSNWNTPGPPPRNDSW
ncbi:prominin-1-A [Cydia splendana]|uniref:prominin-1-A n=1 Tax=Cydia splendana TaxID=1100963 RepID=UPI00300D8632